jgi:hypothetical protein
VEKHLHIVSYAIPYPPDYGGIIDVFYRIKSLHQLGIKIHLHCYEYRGEKNKELESMCYSIHYYPRKLGLRYQFSLLPYIISSRSDNDLLKNLAEFDAPILFDGLHSTYGIESLALYNRKKVVRAHNVEHLYYRILGKVEKNLWKKVYFYMESVRLKRYERVMRLANNIACLSLKDHHYFTKIYGNSVFIPCSHRFFDIESKEGFGSYIIFHGNLMVNENLAVAEWLVKNVAPKISYPFYIAGKGPSESFVNLCSNYPNIKLIADPDDAAMQQLIMDAHIHLLPVSESCGLKLKLLYALYSGRHCLVNDIMTEGTTLAPLCEIANTAGDMVVAINKLFQVPFTDKQRRERKEMLAENYSNIENAKKLIRLLFE